MIVEVLLAAAAAWTPPADMRHIVAVEGLNSQRLVCHVTTNPDAGDIREFDWTRKGRNRILAMYTPAMHEFDNYTNAHMAVFYDRRPLVRRRDSRFTRAHA
jgi:hypothetical protein